MAHRTEAGSRQAVSTDILSPQAEGQPSEPQQARVAQLTQALHEEQERLLHVQVALRQMLEQPDMRANLLQVTEALQALGWRRVILAIYSGEDSAHELITAGVPEDEEEAFSAGVVPEALWQQFLSGELELYRLNGLYYIPVGDDECWHHDDILFASLRLGQGRVVGVIRVQDPVDRTRPTRESLRAADILISQAAYIVENVRLLEESARSAAALTDQVDELSMIHRADRELSAHLDVDRVMTLTMDWALRRTGAETGLLALMADDKRGLVPFTAMGYLGREILECTAQNPWPLERGIIGRTARTGEVQIVQNPLEDPDYVQLVPGAKSLVCVPLSMRGEVLGIIMLASNDLDAFSEHEASFLERLARRAAVALDNARLFRQSEQLADDMAVLYTASRTITATLEREEVLKRTAQSMAVALECSSAIIYDYHSETGEAEVAAVYRLGTARDAREVLPDLKSSFALKELPTVHHGIIRHRTVVLRASDPELPIAEQYAMLENRFHAALVLPLVAQGEIIGVAMIVEGRRDRVFTANEVFKAETLASEAAVALRQAMLYSEVLELEQIKSEMIRMASHDLRNPLNNVLGYIELLAMTLSDGGITPDQDEFITSLRRSAKIMQSLIDDLLTLERVESERESEWQVFDLGGLITEVVEAERSSASLKKQTLRLERDTQAPSIFGSITQLRQAITNLVGNAIKYTPDNGHVTVTFVHEAGRLQFRVVDDGYGISPERQSRIFDRFYRAREPGTDQIPGTGLGLSLVKTVIERHGGQVWFTSAPGKGSTFGFWLPVPSSAAG